MTLDYAEYKLQINRGHDVVEVDVVEVRIRRVWGVERWGVGVGRGGKLLDYFEYARQRDQITATYAPIHLCSPMWFPSPKVVHDAIMVELRRMAKLRYEAELAI